MSALRRNHVYVTPTKIHDAGRLSWWDNGGMANPFGWVWKEVRGNAIWDAIKWLWAAGGSGVTLVLQWIIGVVRGHQDLTATAIVVVAMVFFGIVALVIHNNPVPPEDRRKLPIDDKRRKDTGDGQQTDAATPLKERAGTLTIHSGEWVSIERGTARRVERFIREQIKENVVDSVGFKLINPNLGGELPGAKDTHKILKLSYSYGDDIPREITKEEYDWLILPEPPTDNTRQDQLIKDMEKESLKKQGIRASVWLIKEGAREIKRKWPSADFLDRPANKELWAAERNRPTQSYADDRGWLDSALRWYEAFSASALVKPEDASYLKTADFDELMELLDFYEIEQCGDGYALPLPITAAPANAPAVAIDHFETQGSRYGVVVHNYTDRPAFDIRITPFRVGKYRFSFADTVNTLTKEQGKVFIEATVKAPGTIQMGFSLFDAVRDRFDCSDDGFVPINARVTYRDSAQKRYSCRHEFVQHAMNRDSAFTSVFMRRIEAYN